MQGAGCRVHSSKVQGSELQGAGCSLQDAGLKGAGFRAQGSRVKPSELQGAGFRMLGLGLKGLWIRASGCRVQSSGLKGLGAVETTRQRSRNRCLLSTESRVAGAERVVEAVAAGPWPRPTPGLKWPCCPMFSWGKNWKPQNCQCPHCDHTEGG